MLRLVDCEPPTTLWEAQVLKGSHASGLSPSLRSLTFREALLEAGDRLTQRFTEMDRAFWEGPFSGTLRDGSTTIGGALRYLTYHETLHIGQIGFLLAN